ncbi:MAG: tetratricopeptide repeat protein [Bacteroidales bacterium]|nr:tetratricopeptide repeat protein [Bacteroidales bacterium]
MTRRIFVFVALIALMPALLFAQSEKSVLKKADKLIAKRQYKSAYELLDRYDATNDRAAIVLKKEEIVLNYFSLNIMHMMYALDDLKKGESLDEIRGSMEKMSEMFTFESDSLLLRLLAKNPDDPSLLDGHAAYHYAILFDYGEEMWITYTDSVCWHYIEEASNANVSAKASYLLGLRNTYNADYPSAVRNFKQVIAKDATMWNAYYNMGFAYYNMEQYREALDCFRESYKGYKEIGYKGDAANAMGMIYSKALGNADSGLHCFNLAIQCDPTNLYYHLNRLELFLSMQEPAAYEQMITCWQLAMEDLDNENLFSDVMDMLNMFVEAGRWEEPLAYLKIRADSSESTFEKAMANLYSGLLMAGEDNDAVLYLIRSKELFSELGMDSVVSDIQVFIDGLDH